MSTFARVGHVICDDPACSEISDENQSSNQDISALAQKITMASYMYIHHPQRKVSQSFWSKVDSSITFKLRTKCHIYTHTQTHT